MTHPRNLAWPRLTLAVLLFCTNPLMAGDWDITPRISVAEIYSDNVNLEDSNTLSDLITEISPGISIQGEGGRLKADIDYEMQNLFFLDESDASRVNHQLAAQGTAEISKNLFFIDGKSSMGQSIIDGDRSISNNNINGSGNRADFFTYSLSPYVRPHFGAYADGLFRYTYSVVNFDKAVSDSDTNSFDALLESGRKFGPLSWTGKYNFLDQQRDTATDVRKENTDVQARYRISRLFSLVGTAGYADNKFQTSEKIFNGSYWSVGGFLQPSRFYSLEAQQGNNLSTATLGFYPTRRTSLSLTYRDRDVGLNSGEVWTGVFSHYTRRTRWSARYLEETTTEQEQLQSADVFVPVEFISSLTDEVVERKRASGTFTMDTGKTELRLTVFDDRRRFLRSLRREDTKGFSGSLRRRLAPRTHGILSGTYQRIFDNEDGGDLEDVYGYLRTEVTRQMSRKVTGSLAYQLTGKDSKLASRKYEENRLEMRLTVLY